MSELPKDYPPEPGEEMTLDEWLEKLKEDDGDNDKAWFAAQSMQKWWIEHRQEDIAIDERMWLELARCALTA